MTKAIRALRFIAGLEAVGQTCNGVLGLEPLRVAVGAACALVWYLLRAHATTGGPRVAA